MPRRLLITMVAGMVVAVTVGLVFLVRGMTAPGVFLVVAPPLVTGVNMRMVKRSLAEKQPGAPPRRGNATGRRLVSPSSLARPLPDQSLSWTGGANVVARMGRLNATWPLAVLQVGEETLSLRFRPKLVAMMAGTERLSWDTGDLAALYPVRGRLLGFNQGVAIEPRSGPLAYFWTFQREFVLTALAAHGLPVDWQERNIRLWR